MKIKYGIKNLIRFFPVVWRYRSWDYSYSLDLFKVGLIYLAQCLENGAEIDETRLPKVRNIKRAIEILNVVITDSYFELAEKEIGQYIINENDFFGDNLTDVEKLHNKNVSKTARVIEKELWIELKQILFDSDMRGWWD